ncbi:hypothetical protein GCM10027048_24220 [Hymenobacter coalescens]
MDGSTLLLLIILVGKYLLVPGVAIYYLAKKSKVQTARLLGFLAVSAYFAWLVMSSAWHETGKCSGQGCLIVFPFAAFWYLLAYALLLPAYGWVLAGWRWWQWLLALGAVLLSGLVLRQVAHVFDYSLGGIPIDYRKSEWPFHHLMRLQVLTAVLLLAAPGGRVVWKWLTNDLEAELEAGS